MMAGQWYYEREFYSSGRACGKSGPRASSRTPSRWVSTTMTGTPSQKRLPTSRTTPVSPSNPVPIRTVFPGWTLLTSTWGERATLPGTLTEVGLKIPYINRSIEESQQFDRFGSFQARRRTPRLPWRQVVAAPSSERLFTRFSTACPSITPTRGSTEIITLRSTTRTCSRVRCKSLNIAKVCPHFLTNILVHFHDILVVIPGCCCDTYDLPYDCMSVQHYATNQMSKNGEDTITSLSPTACPLLPFNHWNMYVPACSTQDWVMVAMQYDEFCWRCQL